MNTSPGQAKGICVALGYGEDRFPARIGSDPATPTEAVLSRFKTMETELRVSIVFQRSHSWYQAGSEPRPDRASEAPAGAGDPEV